MGINIGIIESEAPDAGCNRFRSEIVKVHMRDISGFEEGAEYDDFVPYDKAKTAIADWEDFVKRNRLNEEADAVYISKVKKDNDLAVLQPIAERTYTGWVLIEGLPESKRADAIAEADDKVTGWDQLDFDEMNGICSNCKLSWDKGRGCIGAFGPDNSLLPEIASRHGCTIVAAVPKSVEEGKRFTAQDAEQLLKETEILTQVLPEEGKMMVRRYSGPVERMAAVAKVCMDQGCGFFFF